MPAGAAAKQFVAGQRVTFTGLVGRADLNGSSGVINEWLPEVTRWAVELDDGSGVANFKAENILSQKFAVGQRVIFAELKGRADLNGTYGVIKGWNPASERFVVQLDVGGEANLRSENLRHPVTAKKARVETASADLPAPALPVAKATRSAKTKTASGAAATAVPVAPTPAAPAAKPVAPPAGQEENKKRGRPKKDASAPAAAAATAEASPSKAEPPAKKQKVAASQSVAKPAATSAAAADAGTSPAKMRLRTKTAGATGSSSEPLTASVARPAALAVGETVVLCGLAQRADLNGQTGKLLRWDAGNERWEVELASSSEECRMTVNLRPVNMQLAAARPAAASAAAQKAGGTNAATKRAVQMGRLWKGNALRTRAAAAAVAPKAQAAAGAVAGDGKEQAATGKKVASSASQRKGPKKPKQAPSAWNLFQKKTRGMIIEDLRAKGLSTDVSAVSVKMSTMWAGLDDKARQKYEQQSAKLKDARKIKMDAYKAKIDPLGALKKKYEGKIPKKPVSSYFMFQLDPTVRQRATKAVEALGEGAPSLDQKLSEMWKELPQEQKDGYDQRYKDARVEYEKKNEEWQKTPEYKEYAAEEQKLKDIEKAKKRKFKKREDAEIQKLIDEGAKPGSGLGEGKSATITGLTARPDLNGAEVGLERLEEKSGRWIVYFSDGRDDKPMNVKPENLMLTKLLKEIESRKKREEKDAVERAKKMVEQEAKRAVREEANKVKQEQLAVERRETMSKKESERASKDAERAAKLAEQAEKKAAEKAEKAFQREEERLNKLMLQQEEKEKKKAQRLEEKALERQMKLETLSPEEREKLAQKEAAAALRGI
eukprot:TRINITY_DN31466_c0_g1_i1.p1 TRINITY_DN31466_c0_g1~~TRINITY_DN31466_c0_g1_i1.p1  ORF type:complete len:831 (-),score=285.41 TRINITY_DN31466_c0_g1_i1:131-2623(-)